MATANEVERETSEFDQAATTAEAGEALFQGVCQCLMDDRGVHVETAIAATGYLAGTALLACSGGDELPVKPGSYVLIEAVNENGPLLIETLFDLCHRGGVDPDTKMPDAVPASHRPLRDYADLMTVCGPAFERVCERYAIETDLRPFVAVRAAARFVLAGRRQLSPAVALAIATHAVVRASKTMPPKWA